MSLPMAGEIRSNAPASRTTVDQDLSIDPARLREMEAANLRVADRSTSMEAVDLAEREFEMAKLAASRQKWAGQERWEGQRNEEQRFVNILHPHRFCFQLRRAGVDARSESPLVSIWRPGRTGQLEETRITRATGRIWLNEAPRVGLIGVNAWVVDEATGRRAPRTVTSLQYPYGPEWSLMRFDAMGVVTQEKYRGWRTVLLRLILANVITEEEADRAFGPVVLGPVSEFYRQQLQSNRRRRLGMTA